jgi:hypothetical protein
VCVSVISLAWFQQYGPVIQICLEGLTIVKNCILDSFLPSFAVVESYSGYGYHTLILPARELRAICSTSGLNFKYISNTNVPYQFKKQVCGTNNNGCSLKINRCADVLF